MYRNIRRAMAVMFGLALSAAMTFSVSAQEEPMQDVTQDEPVVEESVADGYGKGCCDDCCCASGSFYGEFQYLWFDTYGNEGPFTPHVNEQDGIRLIGGYTGCDGLGVRARYFNFDGVDNVVGLDIEYIDLELTDTFCVCNLNGVVSAGYRHGEYQVIDGGVLADFEGDGVTFGLQLDREVGCNLAAYFWLQHSILFGDDNVAPGPGDEVFGWTEVQLGAQYSTCFGGYDGFLRGGVEAQHHNSVLFGDAPTGLLGLFISAGVNF